MSTLRNGRSSPTGSPGGVGPVGTRTPFAVARLAALPAITLMALGWLACPLMAQQTGPDSVADEELARIIVYSPAAGKPAMGRVIFRADVFSQFEVKEVRLRVDGREVASFVRPPYELPLDLGEQNRSHRFEVVVLGHGLELARLVRETPPIRVDEEVRLGLRQLYVTVSEQGKRVLDLGRDEFEILDEDRHQELVTFEGGDAALAAAILVDASTSMRGARLQAAVQGARAFIRGLKDLDEACLILFSDRLLFDSGFTDDPTRLGDPLQTLSAAGGTALNDHLFFAVKSLESRQGRRVVIVLSDGLDVDSVLSMQQVLWMIQRSRSVVYWIRLQHEGLLGQSVITPWRSAEEHSREIALLEEGVLSSGGRIVPISGPEEAGGAFESILAELREQYVLGYYPDIEHDDGRWRAVTVRVSRPNLEVRTRGGYLDD